MPRQPRLIIEGQPHHIIQRGNNKQVTFVTDEDYQFYLKILKDACIKYQCHIHAYVLMTNHVHLLLTPKENTGISAVMQYVAEPMFVTLMIYTKEQEPCGRVDLNRR